MMALLGHAGYHLDADTMNLDRHGEVGGEFAESQRR